MAEPLRADVALVRLSFLVQSVYAEVSERLLEVVAHLPKNDRRQFERLATSIVHAKCVPAVFGSTDQPATTR